MKRLTLPVFALVAGWIAATIGCGILYGWGNALLGWGLGAIAFSFFAWLWTS